MKRSSPTSILAILSAMASASGASAAVTVFAQNLAGFNAAAGNPPVVMDFDGIPANTDITGQTLAGITFMGPAAPLIVVVGNDTFTPGGFSGAPNPQSNKLFPTSGQHVLSPGGLELAPGPSPLQVDHLTLIFETPVSAFGFDHLSQSADGFSFTTIAVFDQNNVQLHSGSVPISNLGGGGAPAGADFWGIVSTEANVKRVQILEQDGDAQFPDCNIGFDTIRVFPAPCVATPDLDGNGIVEGADLGLLLGAWATGDCAADLNGDGVVNGADLGILLGAWTA